MYHNTSTTTLPTVPEPVAMRKPTVRRFLLIGGGIVSLPIVMFGVFVLITNLLWNGLAAGQPAPDFSGHDLAGNVVRLSDYRDQPVMLTFWSPDCFACREELPALQAIANNPEANVVLLTVVSHMAAADVQSFVQQEKLTFPVIVDEPGTIAPLYQVTGIPFTYFIRPDGRIERAVIGAGNPGDLHDKLQGWLNTCNINAPCTVEE